MIKLKQAVIVEGKYDKIALSNVIDAVIIPVGGFSIYKDSETAALIRSFAEKTGVIILTDSDAAGFQIRARLREICAGGSVVNVYIPDVRGKERRKREPSKEGLLGVEGMSPEILLEAFEKAGVLAQNAPEKPKNALTKSDLMEMGLVGGENSAERRKAFQRSLGLPERLSANMLLEVLNVMYTKEEIENKLGIGG